MSNPSGFTIKVRNDRDIIISKPEAGFEVTYITLKCHRSKSRVRRISSSDPSVSIER